MTTSYLWVIPDEYPSKFIGRYLDDGFRNEFDFRRGMPVNTTEKLIKIKFKCTLGDLGGLGCLCNDSMLPLLSPDVVDVLLEHAGDDVQFFDTIVEAKDGETDRYKLLNITKKVKAIDTYMSDLEYYSPNTNLFKIHKLVLLPNCMQGVSMARSAEFKGLKLVSEELTKQLRKLSKPGIALYTPDEVYRPYR